MQVGFTVTLAGAEARFTLHGPAVRLISVAQSPLGTAVLLGRLHYRDDRLARVRGRVTEKTFHACRASDAALALSLFEVHGAESLEELEGDFALAVWDACGGRLHALRDPLGGFPLFWTQGPGGTALATSFGPLLAFLGRRAISRGYVAEYLSAYGQQNEGLSEECVYDGLHRVLPGSSVILDGGTRTVRRRVYWNWAERVQDPGTSRMEEAGSRYGELLRRAVRERMTGPCLAHLSGGMDSTGVALTARGLIRSGQAAGPLHCASVVYDRLPKLAQESPYVEGVLHTLDDVGVHRISGDDLLDYDAYWDAPPHDEPYPGLWRLQMDRALVNKASEVGAAAVLTGIGADEVCGQQPFHLADLIRAGRLLSTWREAKRWARALNCSKWELLRQFALAPLGWHRRVRVPGGGGRLIDQSDVSIPPWIVRDFVKEYELHDRLRERPRQVFAACPEARLAASISGLRAECGDPVRWAVAAPAGVALAHPFLDPRVLTFALGVQRRFPAEPARMKPLLAEALRDVLPASILRRRAKGHFDEVYYLGLARNLPRLEAMVRSAPLADLGAFDAAALAHVLEEASLAGPDGRKLQRLDHSLALVYWVAHQADWCCEPAGSTPVTAFHPDCAPEIPASRH